jgi:dihydroorotase
LVVCNLPYDVLIKNGTVIDPSQNIYGPRDVGVADGRIVGLFSPEQISGQMDTQQIIDATGCIVTPGWIDLHVHVFEHETELGINADQVGIEQGVTTVVDAGSSGSKTFERFLADSIEPSVTQVLAWLNISEDGLCGGRNELADLRKLRPLETATLVRKYPVIRGIKVRMSRSVVGENGLEPLRIAKALANELDVPVMVHIGNAPPFLGDILDLLTAGDVVTHAFHGKPGGILDTRGHLLPQAQTALDRGVVFDVGHGSASFSFRTMERAKALGIKVQTISTDIYRENYSGPVYSLAMTMSKLLYVGYSLQEVLTAVTSNPARVLRMDGDIGTLRPGTVADVSVFRVVNKPVRLIDSEGVEVTGDTALVPVYTLKNGRVAHV